jgi:digalactosyldiacylglycerol synthase
MFWNGKYHNSFGSIFPTEDICSSIPKDEADIAILEEPEHLNWFRVPEVVGKGEDFDELGWAHKFKHVVGIVS